MLPGSCVGVKLGLSHYGKAWIEGKSRVLRKLYNEELHNFYASPNSIRIIKSRRMRWAGYAARMGKMINANNILSKS
jgi:hypothetical protein